MYTWPLKTKKRDTVQTSRPAANTSNQRGKSHSQPKLPVPGIKKLASCIPINDRERRSYKAVNVVSALRVLFLAGALPGAEFLAIAKVWPRRVPGGSVDLFLCLYVLSFADTFIAECRSPTCLLSGSKPCSVLSLRGT